MLKVGQEILLPESGRRARIQSFIGEGGQGTVFKVAVDTGDSLALKWYFPRTGTENQRQAIDQLVRRGAPTPRFLWPSEMVTAPDTPAFGYLMPIRPSDHETLASLLKGQVTVRSHIRTTLCRDLAHSFLNLHSQGLCYRDISFANIFFDPATGTVLICDNDNVAIDDGSPSPVLGTRKFMAPEIVRGEAEPSTITDLWSLSVLLFYILVVGHPLLGRRELEFQYWDEDAEIEMFGRNPVFIFDPADDSNRPHPDHHGPVSANWPTLTARIRQLFTDSFTAGLSDPRHGRVRESIWQRAMARLEDSIMLCPRCGSENFYDPAERTDCWRCSRILEDPMLLRFSNGRWVAINDATRLSRHHLSRLPNYDFDVTVAEVVQHPERKIWGLRNLGEEVWTVEPPDGDVIEIEPGRSFGLVPGTIFRFGEVDATLEA